MAIRSISSYVVSPTSNYKKIRDIAHEIKRIQAQTNYIREHHVAPKTLKYDSKKNSYALKKLNII